MSQVSWLPWWVLLFVGLVLLAALIAYALMPFAVFGTKPRLDEIERQLDDIRAELRHLARHLAGEVPQPSRPADYAPPPPPRMAPVELTPEPARPEARPAPRVARASDDWGQPARSAPPPPRVPPVRLNDPWSAEETSRPQAPAERAPDSPFLAGDPAGRGGASLSGDRPYEDMPPEGLSQVVRPTHFEPPEERAAGPRREAPRVPQPEWERKAPLEPYAPRSEPVREAPWRRDAPPPRPDESRVSDWERPAVERQAEDRAGEWDRSDRLSGERPASERSSAERPARGREDDEQWRKPRSEPTLRWPPRQ